MSVALFGAALLVAMCSIHSALGQSSCARGTCAAGTECCQPDPERGAVCCNLSTSFCIRDYASCIVTTPVPAAPTPYSPGELLWATRTGTPITQPIASYADDTVQLVIITTSVGIDAVHAATGVVQWSYPHPVKKHKTVQNGSILYAPWEGDVGTLVAIDLAASATSTSAPHVIWTIQLGNSEVNAISASSNNSDPAVIFAHTEDANFQSHQLFAIDPVTGNFLWNTTTLATAIPAMHHGVCVISNDVFLEGRRCADGHLLWSTAKTMSSSGATTLYSVAPLGLVLAYFNEWSTVRIAAVDVATGRVAWNLTHDLFGTGGLLVSSNGERFFTVTSHNGYMNYISAFSTSDGVVVWQTSVYTNSFDSPWILGLAVRETYVLVTYSASYTMAVFVTNGTAAWNSTNLVYLTAIAMSNEGNDDEGSTFYAGAGNSVVAVTCATGKVQWSHATQLQVSCAPIKVGSYVVAGSSDEYVYGYYTGDS